MNQSRTLISTVAMLLLIIVGLLVYIFVSTDAAPQAPLGAVEEAAVVDESAPVLSGDTVVTPPVADPAPVPPVSDTADTPSDTEDVPPPVEEEPAAEEVAVEPEPVLCTADVQQCPDGSYVSRVAPDCAFAACPELPQLEFVPPPVVCPMDAMQCPDGSYVGRVAPDCEFAACPALELQLQMN